MRNLFLILTAAALILFWIVPTYIKMKEINKPVSVIIKCSGTFIAVLFGIFGVLCTPSTNSYWILAGLILGLLGDFLLEYLLPLGGVAFFFGNVIYLSRLLIVSPVNIIQFVLLLAILFFLVVHFHNDFHTFGKLRYLFLLYAILVTFMASATIPYFFQVSGRELLFGFGVFLFAVSDYLLGYRVLYHAKAPFHQISLSTYYLAQLSIGVSIFLTC